MPPFPQVHRDDKLRFQAHRQHVAGEFRRCAILEQGKICPLCRLARIAPELIAGAAFLERRRADDGNLAAELLLIVRTIPRAFLRIAGDTMADNLVRYAAVGYESHGNRVVFGHRLVAVADDLLDKRRVVRPLRLIARAGGAGNGGHCVLMGNRVQRAGIQDFVGWFDDFHGFASSLAVARLQ